jgi:hypothetical protein
LITICFFCGYGFTAGLRMAGVIRWGGGPAPPLVRVDCSRRSTRRNTLQDDPHVAADTPAVDSEVCHSYLLFILVGSPGGAVDAVQLRRPANCRVHGPVATRDAHVPLPRRRDDSQSGGRRDVGRTVVCWVGDGADRHPRDVAGWLPCSVRERSSKWSHAGTGRALRRHPRAHLDLDPTVQRTWF